MLVRIGLLDLPLTYYPWIKETKGKVGKVIGQKPQPDINPRWNCKLLIEVDTSRELKRSIDLYDQEGKLLHSQPITYKNLPNECFECHK